MARRKSRTLTELELEIMQVVWESEQITVDDIQEALEKARRPLAKPSIRKMLSILQKKGYVDRVPLGRAYAYRKIVSQNQANQGFVRDLVERAFGGSAAGLVAALVDTGMVTKSDLDEAKRLIEGGASPKKGASNREP